MDIERHQQGCTRPSGAWTLIDRTLASAHRAANWRLKLRGSTGVPNLVEITKPLSVHVSPALIRRHQLAAVRAKVVRT
jgi:hypothetical protein